MVNKDIFCIILDLILIILSIIIFFTIHKIKEESEFNKWLNEK